MLKRDATHALTEYMNKLDQLRTLIQTAASKTDGFFTINGPGVGDKLTHEFITKLRKEAENTFGKDFAEQCICGTNKLAVDYYFPDEATIVEIALSLRNPNSEFERDIIKAVMAQESGYPVEKLVFIARPGASKAHASPSSQAIINWAERNHSLHILIHEIVATSL